MQSFSSIRCIGLDLRVLAATFLLLGLTCHVGRTAEVSGTSVEDPSRPSSLQVTILCNTSLPSVVSALTSVSSLPPSFSTVLCATMGELPWSPERVWTTHTSVYRLYLPYTDFASSSLFTSSPSWLSPSSPCCHRQSLGLTSDPMPTAEVSRSGVKDPSWAFILTLSRVLLRKSRGWLALHRLPWYRCTFFFRLLVGPYLPPFRISYPEVRSARF